MGAALPLVLEILSLAPQIAEAGINIAGIVSKTRDVLDANAAPGDPEWDALDKQVKDLQARLNAGP